GRINNGHKIRHLAASVFDGSDSYSSIPLPYFSDHRDECMTRDQRTHFWSANSAIGLDGHRD
ncbi:MAG TPA: hypothetical protein VNW47_08850, partial [Terriglobales bacterium]|nr:hypothetical protein [Terriglobales bacterium]